jgi:hypothetical protein
MGKALMVISLLLPDSYRTVKHSAFSVSVHHTGSITVSLLRTSANMKGGSLWASGRGTLAATSNVVAFGIRGTQTWRHLSHWMLMISRTTTVRPPCSRIATSAPIWPSLRVQLGQRISLTAEPSPSPTGKTKHESKKQKRRPKAPCVRRKFDDNRASRRRGGLIQYEVVATL